MQEHALQVRLQHIVHAVEHKEWPVGRNFTAYAEEQPMQVEDYMRQTYNEPSEVITITTDHGPKVNTFAQKRKRHIAIDVETERGKSQILTSIWDSCFGPEKLPFFQRKSAAENSWAEKEKREVLAASVTSKT